MSVVSEWGVINVTLHSYEGVHRHLRVAHHLSPGVATKEANQHLANDIWHRQENPSDGCGTGL